MLLRGVLLWRCVLLWLRVLLRLVLRLVGARVLLCVLAILLLVRRLHVLLHDARVDGACLSGPAHACEIQVKAGRGRSHAGRGRVHITSAIRWQRETNKLTQFLALRDRPALRDCDSDELAQRSTRGGAATQATPTL